MTSLLKGGFRTITGAIGKDSEESYEVRTAVGVLGIRGTSFAVLFCRRRLWIPSRKASGPPIEDGLYVGVTDGIVFFSNEFGEIEIRAGEFVFHSTGQPTTTTLANATRLVARRPGPRVRSGWQRSQRTT